MKRKLTCMIMALVLVISLLPLGAIQAQAASNLNYSENVVNLIKQFEGFSASAYQEGNQWTVGYGTPGYAGQSISEADADQALRSALNSINQAINQFTATNNLYLSQYQHDALVSFSFNCGTSWMNQSGRFRSAVVNGAGVDEFLFAISLWANVGSTPDANLLNRRLAEANLYFNGVYNKAAPASYTYVILNANGGTPGNNGEDKMQAYQTGSNVSILAANPSKSGYSFGGWFTAPSGGSGVKTLSASTAGRTLYAQYGTAVTVTAASAVLRSGAGTSYSQTGTAMNGSKLVIVETVNMNGVQWGRCIDGWIELSATTTSGTLPGTSAGTGTTNGTVVCSTGVNVRAGAGTGYPIVGSAYNGQRVTVYETVSVNGSFWGRIGDGRWISLTYVKLDSTISTGNTDSTTNTGSYQLGTVTASGLNVRAAAGTGSAIVGSLRKGEQVKIYAQTTVGNTLWGQTDKGWVCMNYISISGTVINGGTNNGSSNNGTPIATGTVKAGISLNVRSGAGTAYTKVGTIAAGTSVSIYERVTVNGMEWGRIGSGMWVCMTYINLTSGSTSGGSTTTTGTGTVISSTNLNVRSGAGAGYTKIGSLTPGSQVTIYETVNVNGSFWGRIGTGMWVSMNYIRMNTSTGGTTTGYTGVVTASGLNVRAAAGTNNAIVGRLSAGTVVTITELTNVNGISWGRTSAGWVCMQYIQITGSTGGSNSGSSNNNPGVIWQ